jgi:hypothetical protein
MFAANIRMTNTNGNGISCVGTEISQRKQEGIGEGRCTPFEHAKTFSRSYYWWQPAWPELRPKVGDGMKG